MLLIINEEANNYYYFAIKSLLELNSLEWLQGKKDAINNWEGINFPAGSKEW